jgi:hypothetical protein
MLPCIKIKALKKALPISILLFFTSLCYSQTLLSFCTYVSSDTHECIFDNNKFITSPDSTHARIYMMLRSAQVFGTAKLNYKIYGIDRFGAEVLVNTVTQEVKADWMNSWQPSYFTSPGKYIVKVYTEEGVLIVSKGLELFNL